MHYLRLIISIVSLYMFRAGLLLIIRRINCVKTAVGIDMCYVDWLLVAATSQHSAWLYQLLFIQSWLSWWWAASLLETSRGSFL